MEKNKQRKPIFRCPGGHDASNFVDGVFGKMAPYCKLCRELTPNGKTIITYGYLIYN